MATLTPEERSDRDMAEVPTLTDEVVKMAKRLGWKVFRVRQGRASWNMGSGWPDLTLARGKSLVFIELKRQDKDLEPAQQEWYAALAATGNDIYVFRPKDLRIGLIERILT